LARQVTLSAAADDDLDSIILWLTQPGAGVRAARRRERIAEAIAELAVNPCLWPVGGHLGVRERPIEGHRLMYQVSPDTGSNATAGDVLVIRIFGPFQDRSRL
jgi:plasmid stabilization system protein ParE